MPVLEDAIRPFWLPGLNNVAGRVAKGLGGWICDEEFQVYSPIGPSSFKLTTSDLDPLVTAFAADLNRLAVAAIESAVSVSRIRRLPRSTAWAFIKSYYSAFFAAHAIGRMVGLSVSRLDASQINSVNRIAAIFGALAQPATKGQYSCTLDCNTKELTCSKANLAQGGIHEAFWSAFNTRLRQLSTDILSSKMIPGATGSLASAKLMELSENLSGIPAATGSWLSFMRNEVNYGQRLGTWYPYSGYREEYHDRLIADYWEWTQDPVDIDLTSYGGRELLRFRQTCNFLVSLCRGLVIDMSRRCSRGVSFHAYGSLAIMNLVQQGRGKGVSH